MDKNTENKLMRLLKVHELRILLYRTPLGDLEVKRGKEEETWTYTLDSVPVDKEVQAELAKIFKI